MPRLPIPGSDAGAWGDILNEFLGAEHNADGTQKTLGVAKGGTGATSASAARTSLGAISSSDAQGLIDTHASDTTSVHGISDTSQLLTQASLDTLESQTTPLAGGVMMRDPLLENWFTDLSNATTQPVDLVVVGDSISEFGWVDILERQLTTRYNGRLGVTTSPTIGIRYPGGSLLSQTTVTGGTTTDQGLAGYATDLTNGQSFSQTSTCDGVIVVWHQGTGTLTVRDGGAGGTIVATIDTSTGSGAGNITSINLTTYASHVIWVGSTGNTRAEAVYPTVGNRTLGVRVWRLGHAGYNTNQFGTSTKLALDFIAKLKVHAGRDPHVIIATGFNDPIGTYNADLNTLVSAVRARTNGTVSRWINWGSAQLGGGGADKHAIAVSNAQTNGLAMIDAFRAFGDIGNFSDANSLSDDGAHPNTNGTAAIAIQALAVMSGDPIGSILSMNAQSSYNLTGKITGELDYIPASSGRFQVSSSFGFLLVSLFNNGTDTGAQILFTNQGTANALAGINAAVLAFGPGGTSGQDLFLFRSAAGELTLRQSSSVLGNVVTNLMRYGAGTPEASVTAPVGATYKDTTNGTLYVKTVGTGNTGWQPAAGVQPINTQTDNYTLVLADQGKLIRMNKATAVNLTVPLNSSVAYPVGTTIDISSIGAGQTTVVPTGGVTINARVGLKLTGQYSVGKLVKTATDTWLLSGDLAA